MVLVFHLIFPPLFLSFALILLFFTFTLQYFHVSHIVFTVIQQQLNEGDSSYFGSFVVDVLVELAR